MRWPAPHHRIWLWLIIVVLLFGTGTAEATEEPDADEDSNWIEETLHRFFGNKALTGENLEGEGLELVGPYVKHEGKTIEVVIVRQVKSFEEGWTDERVGAERMLYSLSSHFQDYTREFIIRQYFLFKAGDQLVPFDLADTERMLRDLPYINDLRIHVVPIDGDDDKVGIVVETNDRWPLGVSATVITADKWRAKLYSNNVAGLGISFSNEVLRNKESSKDWGYRGEFFKRNIAGSFWDSGIEYEDSYRKKNLLLGLNRSLIHPGVNYIGGVVWQDLEEFDNDESKRAFDQGDVWAGKVIKLYDRMTVGGGARPILVPAVRVLDRDHYKRPVVYPDSNRGYHDYTRYMTSLTWQRLESYKTSYLFGEGEVEDLITGKTLKLTTAFEEGEFEDRPGLFFESAIASMRNRGDITFFKFSLGGFFENKQVSDGVLNVYGSYFSQLFGSGKIRHRLFAAMGYTLGVGRHTYDRIYLSDKSGIYNLENGFVAGNQRLVFRTHYRMFTPLALWGFRMSFFCFADVGAIGDEDSALLKEKFYLSTGLGVRFRNPSLVLPTFQLRMSLITNVDDPGLRFGVNLGNAPIPDIQFPSNRPSTLSYE